MNWRWLGLRQRLRGETGLYMGGPIIPSTRSSMQAGKSWSANGYWHGAAYLGTCSTTN
jgi:hypothetical protein